MQIYNWLPFSIITAPKLTIIWIYQKPGLPPWHPMISGPWPLVIPLIYNRFRIVTSWGWKTIVCQGFFSKFLTSTPILVKWWSLPTCMGSGHWLDINLHLCMTSPKIAFFCLKLTSSNGVFWHFLSCYSCGNVTTSQVRSRVVTDSLFTDVSECPETETVANTLWLVTNSKSCPNCKWVGCLSLYWLTWLA